MRARFAAIAVGLVLATLAVPGLVWLSHQVDPDDLPEWVFDALETVGIATDTIDPDRPPHVGRNFNEADYLMRRSEYTARLRGVEPGQPVRPDRRMLAVAQHEVGKAQAAAAARAANAENPSAPDAPPVWQELGPAPIPNGQVQGATPAPVSGRVTAIEIDPANANIVYVGTAQGGVYRSTDGGANWTAIFDGAQSLAIGALALAPSNATILYVGTGEANLSGDSYSGVGLYRIDAAPTTASLSGPINPVPTNNGVPGGGGAFSGRSIARILVHPTDPATIFVATSSGVIGAGADNPLGGTVPPLGLKGLYRSTNATAATGAVTVERLKVSTAGGCADTPCTGNRWINDMVLDPGDPNTVILWQLGDSIAGDGGVWRSTNALASPASAVTFTQRYIAGTAFGRGGFAIYKEGGNPAVVYLANEESSSGTSCTSGDAGALRVSVDDGVNWSGKLLGGGGFCGGQCFYDIGLAVNPGATTARADDLVLLGGSTSSPSCTRINGRSTDGGNTFANNDTFLHADVHAIKMAPSDPTIVYHGDDGGIFKSTDSGQTWTSLNNGQFSATQYQSLAVHPTDLNFTIGGTQDNGTIFRRPNSSFTRADFGDGGFSAIDQGAADTSIVTMYHTYFNLSNVLIGYARVDTSATASDGNWVFFGCDDPGGGPVSHNGITCTDGVNFYAPLVLGPGNPSPVYFGSDRLYRSVDKGVNNSVVSQTFTGDAISAIGVALTDDNVRIVGLAGGGLFYTTTGSTSLVDLDPGNTIPNVYVARAVIDRSDKTTAYITLDGYLGGTGGARAHVWKVTHLDTTPVLTPINGGLPDVPVNAFASDPLGPAHLFVGTDVGVYESTNGGASWSPYGTGLPTVAVFDMAVLPGGGVLRIATHGRGLWQIAIPSVNLTITKSGAGTVTSSPAGITCGAICIANYTIGTQVTLSATPATGSVFAGWSGGCSGTGTCVVTLNADATVTATFTLTTPALTVSTTGTGSGTVTSSPPGITCGADCTENYAFGTQVTLTASPASGSTFTSWSGACSGAGPCVVTMDAAKSVTATFTLTTPTLTVTRVGAGTGTVTSNDGKINCGSACSASYLLGVQTTLTATPTTGSTFAGWSGACTGGGSCQVTLDAVKTVTATFQPAAVGVNVGRLPGNPPGGPTLTATLTARSGCGSIDHIQFGSPGAAFDNALVTITSPSGGPVSQTASFTYTPPAGSTSVTLTIQRVVQSGGALVSPIHVVDGCGDWQTLVGGGADAFR